MKKYFDKNIFNGGGLDGTLGAIYAKFLNILKTASEWRLTHGLATIELVDKVSVLFFSSWINLIR